MKKFILQDFNPNDLSQQGFRYIELGQYSLALPLFEKLLNHFPENIDLINTLGFLKLQLGSYCEAIDLYNKSINLSADQWTILFNKAIALDAIGKKKEAIEIYNFLIQKDPKNTDLYINKGNLHQDLNEFDEALASLDIGIQINPRDVRFYLNQGNVYQEMSKFQMAVEAYEKGINLGINSNELMINKANALYDLGKVDEAIAIFKGIIKADSFDQNAKFNYSLLLLKFKKFKLGWKYYVESRPDSHFNLKKDITRLHKGLRKKDAKIIVLGEQGIGDQIIFGSLLSELSENYSNLTVAIDQRLLNLFNRKFSKINFISIKGVEFDSSYEYFLPIADLGYFYRDTVQSFNKQLQSFLIANQDKKNQLRKRLESDKNFLCGIAWFSSQKKIGFAKSLSLKQLLPILSLPNVTFVDLQYGDTKTEKQSLFNEYGIEIKSIDEIDNFNDIDGLASLIDACDFVVTSSNVTAHLAGALGKKTYLLAPEAHGRICYWHNDDSYSIWYPSIRIFNQDNLDWTKPIEKIKKCIKKELVNEKN